jgi:signal transduction histidine kinase
MSIRVRLILLVLTLVVVVTAALSGLQVKNLIDNWSADALARAQLTAQQTKSMLLDQIDRATAGRPAPAGLDALKELYTETIRGSPEIAQNLIALVATMKVVVEIHIAGEDGLILSSSNPTRVGTLLSRIGSFEDWRTRSWWRRMAETLHQSGDYQVVVPLGLAGSTTPLFTIQVVVSSVILRADLLPQLRDLGILSVFALLLALGLGLLAANIALHPLTRISKRLDEIATGTFRTPVENSSTRELAAVESKLNVLGLRDVEARRALATQSQMPNRLSAISRLTSGVAHEIKNPLNAIALRLELLRAKTTKDHPELEDDFSILSREVTRLDRVVKTFLDFTRPVEVAFAEIDLSALAADIVKLLTPQARAQKVDIQFTAPTAPARIRGDADLLRQAILNVVTNGIESMPDGGILAVRVESAPDHCTLVVADQGPGIPEELRHKVFQLYFTTKERGSGIGLAMTFRAVQIHNGTIAFVSEKEKGTEFRLQFPALA